MNKDPYSGQPVMSTKQKLKQIIKDIPNKKGYVEFVTAMLSVPIMFTVLTSNIINLQKTSAKTEPSTPAQAQTIKIVPVESTLGAQTNSNAPSQNILAKTSDPTPTPTSCIKDIGPVSISYPSENQTVSSSPVCIDISHNSDYCSVLWSYKLDGGAWSQYLDKSICLLNLSSGSHQLDVTVRSTATGKEELMHRSFIYSGSPTSTPVPAATITPTPMAASSSASL